MVCSIPNPINQMSDFLSDFYFVKRHAVHRFKSKKNIDSCNNDPDHSLPLNTKVDVWFADKRQYFTGKICAIEEQPDTYTILFHSAKNTGISLSQENCTSGRVIDSDNEDRWNLFTE
jgi:hypothetical protein